MRERKINNIWWISVVKPTRDEIEELRGRFKQIHPLIIEDLTSPTLRPHVEHFDDHLYMVLHFPRFIKHEHRTVSHEIDFILTKDTMITVQYDDIDILERFWEECMHLSSEVQEEYGKTPIHLLYYLLRSFFANSFAELDQIQAEIDMIEDKVFSGNQAEILQSISLLKRNILDFRRAVKPEQLTLQSLQLRAEEQYDASVQPYLRSILDEYLRVLNLLENHKETVDALYETNTALLNTQTNSVVRAFTILAFATFIPTMISSLFGMNVLYTPLTQDPNSFWHILLLIFGVMVLVYAILKNRGLI